VRKTNANETGARMWRTISAPKAAPKRAPAEREPVSAVAPWKTKYRRSARPVVIHVQLSVENRIVIAGMLQVLRTRLDVLRTMGPHQYPFHRHLAGLCVLFLEHLLSTKERAIVIDRRDVVRQRAIMFLDQVCAGGVREMLRDARHLFWVRELKRRALRDVVAEGGPTSGSRALCHRCMNTVRVVYDEQGYGRLAPHVPCTPKFHQR